MQQEREIQEASDYAYVLIRYLEGLKLRAYLCPGGVWTIGYGNTRNVRPTTSISRAEAERRLQLDVREVESIINENVEVPLSQGEYDALVCFVFNIGKRAFKKSTLLRKLNEGQDRKEVAKEFDKWVFSKGKKLEGLIRRRKFERNLFEGILIHGL